MLRAVTPGIKQLDSDGDAILVIQGEHDTEKLLVSSKVLQLATPVFAALFSGNFSEAAIMMESDCPEIVLRDDDPTAMRIILGVLHYREPKDVDKMDAGILANVIIHCDKYNCYETLKLWLRNQFNSVVKSIRTADVYGYGRLLLAAHICRDAEIFDQISVKAYKKLTPDALKICESHQDLDLLSSRGVMNELIDGIRKMQIGLQNEVQSVERRLKRWHTTYMSPLRCLHCRMPNWRSSGKCLYCNAELYAGCTDTIRVSLYFDALGNAGIWPSVAPFQEYSVSKLASRIFYAYHSLEHNCEGQTSCPLRQEMLGLVKRTEDKLQRISGSSLYSLNRGENDSDDGSGSDISMS